MDNYIKDYEKALHYSKKINPQQLLIENKLYDYAQTMKALGKQRLGEIVEHGTEEHKIESNPIRKHFKDRHGTEGPLTEGEYLHLLKSELDNKEFDSPIFKYVPFDVSKVNTKYTGGLRDIHSALRNVSDKYDQEYKQRDNHEGLLHKWFSHYNVFHDSGNVTHGEFRSKSHSLAAITSSLLDNPHSPFFLVKDLDPGDCPTCISGGNPFHALQQAMQEKNLIENLGLHKDKSKWSDSDKDLMENHAPVMGYGKSYLLAVPSGHISDDDFGHMVHKIHPNHINSLLKENPHIPVFNRHEDRLDNDESGVEDIYEKIDPEKFH